MRKLFLLLTLPVYAFASAACPRVPSADMSKTRASYVKKVDYQLLGTSEGRCWYFRDIVLKNEHGRQDVIFTSPAGVCKGLYSISASAKGHSLRGNTLVLKSDSGDLYRFVLTSEVPKSLFFDGNISELEQCTD